MDNSNRVPLTIMCNHGACMKAGVNFCLGCKDWFCNAHSDSTGYCLRCDYYYSDDEDLDDNGYV